LEFTDRELLILRGMVETRAMYRGVVCMNVRVWEPWMEDLLSKLIQATAHLESPWDHRITNEEQ